jgi:hypothetical protein
MRISPWRVDKFGNLTRTVRGIAAPAPALACAREFGRSGGLATARMREGKEKPAEVKDLILSSPQ